MTRGTQLELRPQALVDNATLAAKLAGDARVYAMVKANGYGHGLAYVAQALAACVDGFGVAVIEEAVTLREQGVSAPLMLLEGCFDVGEWRLAQQLRLDVVVHSAEQVEMLADDPLHGPVNVWLKVDTGMHRLGVPVDQVPALIETLRARADIRLAGLMTHFACADMADEALSQKQLHSMASLCAKYSLPYSAANSAALLQYSDDFSTSKFPLASQGDRVRPGIMLYGSSPFAQTHRAELGLSVTQQFSARLIAVNHVKKGETVGYGASWVAPRDSRIGIVAVGYGDGYPRHASNGAPVAIEGVRTHTVGRVSMDMTAIDLTDIATANVGDRVELWGDVVSVDEVAAFCGTISYELFCQVTARVHRVIVHGEA